MAHLRRSLSALVPEYNDMKEGILADFATFAFVAFGETIFYVIFAGFVFVVIFGIGVFWLAVTKAKKDVHQFAVKLKNFALFWCLLFIYGAIGNALWASFFNDRFYIAKDPITYFIPIVPFGWWAICQPCGSKLLGGVEMWHLQLIWLFGAIIAWCLTIMTYRAIKRMCTNQRLHFTVANRAGK